MTPLSEDPPADDRPARLAALMLALHAHEFVAKVVDDVLKVSTRHRPGHEIEVWVAHRATDGGRLWFVSGTESIADADDITGALMAIKGLTTVRM